VLFVLPLLIFYEAGLYMLGPAPTDDMRSGADAWLRGILQRVGISPLYGAPVLLLAGLLVWSIWRRGDRPRDFLGVWIGMIIESAAFALGLLCLSQALFPLLHAVGHWFETPTVRLVSLTTGSAALQFAWEQIIGYVGAGIYEETLFRLLMFSGLAALMQLLDVRRWLGLAIAAILSSLAFAAAHNLGPHGETFQLVTFLFRMCAGLYFTWIYHLRGFGIAVGAHASYDVLVGMLVRSV
jgi:membrane protease YdiL (CAAX protease family)